MCGICGVIGIEGSEQAEAITRRMMEALWHRGPDEDGLLVAPGVTLGMRGAYTLLSATMDLVVTQIVDGVPRIGP